MQFDIKVKNFSINYMLSCDQVVASHVTHQYTTLSSAIYNNTARRGRNRV